MRKALKGVARDITHDLLRDLRSSSVAADSPSASISNVLLRQLAAEVVRQLEANSREVVTVEDLDGRLRDLETKLDEITGAGDDEKEEKDEDEDEVDGTGSSMPNLNYAKPKYKDVDSVLKYIESADEKGIKLVIMNFND